MARAGVSCLSAARSGRSGVLEGTGARRRGGRGRVTGNSLRALVRRARDAHDLPGVVRADEGRFVPDADVWRERMEATRALARATEEAADELERPGALPEPSPPQRGAGLTLRRAGLAPFRSEHPAHPEDASDRKEQGGGSGTSDSGLLLTWRSETALQPPRLSAICGYFFSRGGGIRTHTVGILSPPLCHRRCSWALRKPLVEPNSLIL